MPSDSELLAQVNTLGAELQNRIRESLRVTGYYEGGAPFPKAVIQARMTNAYRLLMPMAEVPWGSVVVDSVQDRLEVAGIRVKGDGGAQVAEQVWGVWQDNQMDAESKLAHNSAFIDGRCFATVWPDETGKPEIVLDDSRRVIVQYQEGSRRRRIAAMRYWLEGPVPMVTLYRSDGIYKFEGPKNSSGFDGTQWERRIVDGEPWPLENPLGSVPVVELAVNRRLKGGRFGYARGEYAHVTGLIDRINLLTFLGLVVALWLGFPLRGVIGDRIVEDDDGNVVAPFDADADKIFQLENPDAKLAEYKAADRGNLAIYPELQQLAYVTKTPAHYFPSATGMSNISEDTVRAFEGGLQAKLLLHKGTLGEGWEELLRLGGRLLEPAVDLSARAELIWKDSEFRSFAERADAATKLKDLLPWQALAEKVLDASQDEIDRWSAMRGSDALTTLFASAASGGVAPPPAAA